MPKISSDLTSRNFQTTTRQFEVSDETGATYEDQFEESPYAQNIDVQAANQRLASMGLPPLNAVTAKALQARSALQSNQHQPLQPNQVSDVEQQIASARKARATGKERLNEGAIRRIEMLCGMFNSKREVDFDGNVFTLRTLNGKEIREVMKKAAEHDGTVELPFETRKQFLAYSLIEVAGNDVGMFLGDDSMEARAEFVEGLPEPILNRLYNEYLSLVQESNSKYAIKSTADAEEVAEDLKK